MLRILLPALAVALLATQVATAQTSPVASAPKEVRVAYRKAAKAERVLSKREKAAAAAATRAEQARQQAQAATAAASTTWSGWSSEPMPEPAPSRNAHAVGYNSMSAPGMPLNQLGHGVSTDYSGRPIRPAGGTTIGR